MYAKQIYEDFDISTHTLTWSVTFSASSKLPSSINFNSHAHVERDCHTVVCGGHVRNFNSHAHVERDKYEVFWSFKISNFNSHAHVERDKIGLRPI